MAAFCFLLFSCFVLFCLFVFFLFFLLFFFFFFFFLLFGAASRDKGGFARVNRFKPPSSFFFFSNDSSYPISILYNSKAGRYRPVRVVDGPLTARCRFIKNADWEAGSAFAVLLCL